MDDGCGSRMIVFFGTWVAQGIAQSQTETDEQLAYGESTEVSDFLSEFATQRATSA